VADEILRIGAEFDVSQIVAGAQAASASMDKIADSVKQQADIFRTAGLTTEETALALRALGYTEEQVAAAVTVEAAATETATVATTGFERAAAQATGRVLGMEAGLGMAGGALGRLAGYLPGMGPLFVAALPVALIAMAVEKISALREEEEKQVRQAHEWASESYEITESIELENLKIQQQIEALEGGPKTNQLQIALMEAQMAADKLAKSLDDVLEKQTESLGTGWSSIFTKGDANEKPIQEELKPINQRITLTQEKADAAPAGSEEHKAAIRELITLYNQYADVAEAGAKKLQDLSAANVKRVQDAQELGESLILPTNFDSTIDKLQEYGTKARQAANAMKDMQSQMGVRAETGNLEAIKAQGDAEKKRIDQQLAAKNALLESGAGAGAGGDDGSVAQSNARVQAIQNEINALNQKEAVDKRVAGAAKTAPGATPEAIATATRNEATTEEEYTNKRIELMAKLSQAKSEMAVQDSNLLEEQQRNAEEEMRKELEQFDKEVAESWKRYELNQEVEEGITREVTEEIARRKKASDDYTKREDENFHLRIRNEEEEITRNARLEESKRADESPMTRARHIQQVDDTEVNEKRPLENESYTHDTQSITTAISAVQQENPQTDADAQKQKDELAKLYQDLEALAIRHNAAMKKLDDEQTANGIKAAKAYADAWKPVENEIDQGLAKVTQSVIGGTVRMSEAFRRMGVSLVTSAIESFEKWVVHQAIMEARSLAMSAAKYEREVVLQEGAVQQQQSISLASHLKQIILDAKGAASGAWHWVMATIPFPLDLVLAPAAAAGAFASTMAFAEEGGIMPADMPVYAHAGEMILPEHISTPLQGVIPAMNTFNAAMAEEGGIMPADMPVYAHAGEMILPEHISTPLQGVIPAMDTFNAAMNFTNPPGASPAAGPGIMGGDTHVHLNVTTMDEKGVQDFLHKNQAAFKRMIERSVRNGQRTK
jgi:hypothetical protein